MIFRHFYSDIELSNNDYRLVGSGQVPMISPGAAGTQDLESPCDVGVYAKSTEEHSKTGNNCYYYIRIYILLNNILLYIKQVLIVLPISLLTILIIKPREGNLLLKMKISKKKLWNLIKSNDKLSFILMFYYNYFSFT